MKLGRVRLEACDRLEAGGAEGGGGGGGPEHFDMAVLEACGRLELGLWPCGAKMALDEDEVDDDALR